MPPAGVQPGRCGLRTAGAAHELHSRAFFGHNAGMLSQLLFYFELLAFLAGTLLYGFLAREIYRRRDVLPGNRPLRAAAVTLTLWFGVTLIDHQAFLLLGLKDPAAVGAIFDLIRAGAWLLSFPLLAHVMERVLALELGSSRLAPLAWAAYAPLLLLLVPFIRFARSGETLLVPATRAVFPLVIFHAAFSLVLAMVLAEAVARRLKGRLRIFIRVFAGTLAMVCLILVSSLLVDPWASEPGVAGRLARTGLLSSLLLPGLLFAYFVRTYHLLHLSLSFRTVRHFVTAILMVLAIIAAGPVLGVEDEKLLRRALAAALLVGLLLGGTYAPLADRLLGRSRTLRNFFGKGVSPRELDRLVERLQVAALEDGDTIDRAAAELGRWLGEEVRLLESPEDGPENLWKYFQDSGESMVTRHGSPSPELARSLGKAGLHAAYALRVDQEVEVILGLPATSTGGGYADGQLEAVRLASRQLAGSLALRKLAESRIRQERLQEGQERLSMLGMVAASLAHEVKNPLSSMKALAQTLREDLATAVEEEGTLPAEGVEDLDHIVEQIDRLNRTTVEILGLARPGEGEVTELAELVASTLYVLKAEARKRAVEIDSSGLQIGATVRGTAASWQTVVFNLVLNALLHTASGGTVRVSLEHRPGVLVFATSNPCEPKSEAEIEQLFQPFVTSGGTGLGLPLVARRVRELGGRVQVRWQEGQLRFEVAVSHSGGDATEGKERT